jgi:lambda repressor-like predicted transcriptional regulator
VTSQQILDFLTSNPGMSDADIVAAMEQYGVSPAQMAQAVGISEGEVASRVAATIPQGQTITLGDTIVQPQYQVTGSGEDQQIGGLENVLTYKVGENQVGGGYNQYNPDGTLQRTGTQQKVDNLAGEALLGSALLFGGLGGGFESLFGGAGTVGNTGMTLSELTQLDMALGGAGGTTGALTLAEQLGGLAAGTLTGAVTGGSSVTGMGGGTGLLAGSGGLGLSTVGAGLGAAGTGAGITAGTGLGTGVLTGSGLGTALSGLGTTLGGASSVLSGLTGSKLGSLINTGLTTTGGLLQQQTSREAAQKAQAMIDRETAAAKQAAQFRPVGMTTRFGTSEFKVDPVTGQITSAGYTLSPEAKAAQDRLVNLAGQGLTQAEQAQQQFAPLQAGAQRLFGLGNQYLAQTPEQVAQNYMNQQLALLQPGRELELANLQNKLQQQGRAGLSVAQGGTLGATTPELQALYNARAMQEAQLAAQAQQAGQQQVQFGAGLLGQGAGTLGQYYAGQQAAYAPYTTALGQVQALETAAQQPFTMGVGLGQTAAQAGANVGQLGLKGAGLSTALATGEAATNNPYASLLSGLGGSNSFGTAVGGLISDGLAVLPSVFGSSNSSSSSSSMGNRALPADYENWVKSVNASGAGQIGGTYGAINPSLISQSTLFS